MSLPFVSSIMATKNRVEMAARALSQFAAQDYGGPKEIVVVDSGDEELPDEIQQWAEAHGKYVRMSPRTPLGVALQRGVEASGGAIIHKWDDDDLYKPGFLSHAVEAGMSTSTAGAVVWGRFLVVTPGGRTRLANNGMLGGGSIVLPRYMLDRVGGFRPVAAGVDRALFEDIGKETARIGMAAGDGITRVADAPELYTVVRHGGNLWRTVAMGWGNTPAEVDVDLVLGMLPEWTGARI